MATKLAARPPSAPEVATSQAAGQGLLFLREEQLRLTQELLFFAYRDFTGAADPVLAAAGLGRAHHRALHFIGARPGITVSELLGILRITKQSLARVLGHLLEAGHVEQRKGTVDRREKHLHLTERGAALERELFACQREKLVAAFSEAGFAAVEGFRRVLRGLTDEASAADGTTKDVGR
jgi:DNA-binding MarR family transcriptional regulator